MLICKLVENYDQMSFLMKVRSPFSFYFSLNRLTFFNCLQEHEDRRRLLAIQNYRQKKEKSETQDAHFNSKFQKRLTDQQRREHEDHLKYFQVGAFWDLEYFL